MPIIWAFQGIDPIPFASKWIVFYFLKTSSL